MMKDLFIPNEFENLNSMSQNLVNNENIYLKKWVKKVQIRI